MKGATTVPLLSTINDPNKTRIIKMGKSQYFFLIFRKSQNSLKNSIIKIASSYFVTYFLYGSNKKIHLFLILEYLYSIT